MPCYHPLHGYICQDGKFRMSPKGDSRSQTVPCNQCIGCRMKRARDWAIRCMHEASLYKKNCFITLTYNQEHVPLDGSLHYIHFQEFMKRLRFHYKGHDSIVATRYDKELQCEVQFSHWPIRFYMAGEYGDDFKRPHFHACIFNFDFPDKKLWKKTPSGSLIYRSEQLEKLWTSGFSSVGDVTFQSAAYVARYINKKITGKDADNHYETVDENGVVTWRTPEFNKMSLKPGIGSGWFDKFNSDVYPHDYVVMNGKKVKPPRYYDKLYSKSDEISFIDHTGELVTCSPQMEDLQYQRHIDSKKCLDDATPDRLAVREQVALANSKKLKRNLK